MSLAFEDDKILTSNPFIDLLLYNLKVLSFNTIIKDQYSADSNETLESLKNSDLFLACYEKHAEVALFPYIPHDILVKAGVPENQIQLYENNDEYDPFYLPKEYHEAILKLAQPWFVDQYVEMNEYYRMIVGLPPLGDPGVPMRDYEYLLPDDLLDYTGEFVHETGTAYCQMLDNMGILDIIKADFPDAKYLDYVTKGLDIYTVRRKMDFQILYYPTTCDIAVTQEFLLKYEENRKYMIAAVYSKAMELESEYYHSFMIIYLVITVMLDMLMEVQSHIVKKDILDRRCIQYIFSIYGIPYYRVIPYKYQERMCKNVWSLVKYKSCTQEMLNIIDLFGFDDIHIFKYYLLKVRKTNAWGEYEYNETTKLVCRYNDIIEHTTLEEKMSSPSTKPPIPPNLDWYEKNGKITTFTRDRTSNLYSFNDEENVISSTIEALDNSDLNDEYDNQNNQFISTRAAGDTVRYIKYPFDYFLQKGNVMFVKLDGRVLVEGVDYTISNYNTITFHNNIANGKSKVTYEFYYDKETVDQDFKIDLDHAINMDVKQFKKCKKGQVFDLNPVKWYSYFPNENEVIVSVSSVWLPPALYSIDTENYTLTIDPFVSIDGRVVTVILLYSKALHTQFEKHNVTAVQDGQTDFFIPEPFQHYCLNENKFFITMGSVYVNQDRYKITASAQKNQSKISFTDGTRVERGRNLTFNFLYSTNAIWNPITLKTKTIHVVATEYYQSVFNIDFPVENYVDCRYKVFIKLLGWYLSETMFEIVGNTIVFMDQSIALQPGDEMDVILAYIDTDRSKGDTNIMVSTDYRVADMDKQSVYDITFPTDHYHTKGNLLLVDVEGIYLTEGKDYTVNYNDADGGRNGTVTLLTYDYKPMKDQRVNYTFYWDYEAEYYAMIEQQQIPIERKGQNTFTLAFPFFPYIQTGNSYIVMSGSTIVTPDRISWVDQFNIKIDELDPVEAGGYITVLYIYNNYYIMEHEEDLIVEWIDAPVLSDQPYVEVPVPFENYIENDWPYFVTYGDRQWLSEDKYEVYDSSWYTDPVTDKGKYGSSITFTFIYLKREPWVVEVTEEDYKKDMDLYFSKIPLEDLYSTQYMKDPTNWKSYESITLQDGWWDGLYYKQNNHEQVIDDIYHEKWNYARSKYYGIFRVMDIVKYSSMISYFYSMLYDDVFLEEELKILIPSLSPYHKFRLADLFIYMTCLTYIFNEMEDFVLDQPDKIMMVQGFNFKASMTALKKYLRYHHEEQKKFDIWDFIIPTEQIPDLEEFMNILNTNWDVRQNLVQEMIDSEDYREYHIWKHIYDALMVWKLNFKFFTLENGKVATTYTEFLKEKDSVLYNSLQEIKAMGNYEEQQDYIVQIVDDIVYVLDEFINGEWKCVFDRFPGQSPNDALKYILLVISFFKSYKIVFLSKGIQMNIGQDGPDEETFMKGMDLCRIRKTDNIITYYPLVEDVKTTRHLGLYERFREHENGKWLREDFTITQITMNRVTTTIDGKVTLVPTDYSKDILTGKLNYTRSKFIKDINSTVTLDNNRLDFFFFGDHDDDKSSRSNITILGDIITLNYEKGTPHKDIDSTVSIGNNRFDIDIDGTLEVDKIPFIKDIDTTLNFPLNSQGGDIDSDVTLNNNKLEYDLFGINILELVNTEFNKDIINGSINTDRYVIDDKYINGNLIIYKNNIYKDIINGEVFVDFSELGEAENNELYIDLVVDDKVSYREDILSGTINLVNSIFNEDILDGNVNFYDDRIFIIKYIDTTVSIDNNEFSTDINGSVNRILPEGLYLIKDMINGHIIIENTKLTSDINGTVRFGTEEETTNDIDGSININEYMKIKYIDSVVTYDGTEDALWFLDGNLRIEYNRVDIQLLDCSVSINTESTDEDDDGFRERDIDGQLVVYKEFEDHWIDGSVDTTTTDYSTILFEGITTIYRILIEKDMNIFFEVPWTPWIGLEKWIDGTLVVNKTIGNKDLEGTIDVSKKFVLSDIDGNINFAQETYTKYLPATMELVVTPYDNNILEGIMNVDKEFDHSNIDSDVSIDFEPPLLTDLPGELEVPYNRKDHYIDSDASINEESTSEDIYSDLTVDKEFINEDIDVDASIDLETITEDINGTVDMSEAFELNKDILGDIFVFEEDYREIILVSDAFRYVKGDFILDLPADIIINNEELTADINGNTSLDLNEEDSDIDSDVSIDNEEYIFDLDTKMNYQEGILIKHIDSELNINKEYIIKDINSELNIDLLELDHDFNIDFNIPRNESNSDIDADMIYNRAKLDYDLEFDLVLNEEVYNGYINSSLVVNNEESNTDIDTDLTVDKNIINEYIDGMVNINSKDYSNIILEGINITLNLESISEYINSTVRINGNKIEEEMDIEFNTNRIDTSEDIDGTLETKEYTLEKDIDSTVLLGLIEVDEDIDSKVNINKETITEDIDGTLEIESEESNTDIDSKLNVDKEYIISDIDGTLDIELEELNEDMDIEFNIDKLIVNEDIDSELNVDKKYVKEDIDVEVSMDKFDNPPEDIDGNVDLYEEEFTTDINGTLNIGNGLFEFFLDSNLTIDKNDVKEDIDSDVSINRETTTEDIDGIVSIDEEEITKDIDSEVTIYEESTTEDIDGILNINKESMDHDMIITFNIDKIDVSEDIDGTVEINKESMDHDMTITFNIDKLPYEEDIDADLNIDKEYFNTYINGSTKPEEDSDQADIEGNVSIGKEEFTTDINGSLVVSNSEDDTDLDGSLVVNNKDFSTDIDCTLDYIIAKYIKRNVLKGYEFINPNSGGGVVQTDITSRLYYSSVNRAYEIENCSVVYEKSTWNYDLNSSVELYVPYEGFTITNITTLGQQGVANRNVESTITFPVTITVSDISHLVNDDGEFYDNKAVSMSMADTYISYKGFEVTGVNVGLKQIYILVTLTGTWANDSQYGAIFYITDDTGTRVTSSMLIMNVTVYDEPDQPVDPNASITIDSSTENDRRWQSYDSYTNGRYNISSGYIGWDVTLNNITTEYLDLQNITMSIVSCSNSSSSGDLRSVTFNGTTDKGTNTKFGLNFSISDSISTRNANYDYTLEVNVPVTNGYNGTLTTQFTIKLYIY